MSREIVLVTGARGFVGRWTLEPLMRCGFEVHAIRTRPDPPVVEGVVWHTADLLTAEGRREALAASRPQRVLHCAWYVEHGKFWTSPENDRWQAASAELATEFMDNGGHRFVGVGSCAEYATQAAGDGLPWPENRLVDPATPYGVAKAKLAARLGAAARPGVTTAWARLFHMFGPDEPPARLVPSVMGAVLAGQKARCGSGRPVRDFCSTWFIGEALAALVGSDVTGAVNIASGEAVTIADMAMRIGTLCGRPDLVQLGALPDRPDDVPFMVADITRLRREVGLTAVCDVAGDLRRLRDERIPKP